MSIYLRLAIDGVICMKTTSGLKLQKCLHLEVMLCTFVLDLYHSHSYIYSLMINAF